MAKKRLVPQKRIMPQRADILLAPMVVMTRLPLMAAEAHSGRWAVETARAVNEKVAATAEGIFAAQMSLFHSATRFWPEVLSGRTPSIFSGAAIERSMCAAMKPVSGRVRANFDRLCIKD